jgi:hypothetical protein
MDRDHGRAVAADADQRGDDVGTWLSQALALRARYRGQTLVAASGAAGAAGLLIAWATNGGIGG